MCVFICLFVHSVGCNVKKVKECVKSGNAVKIPQKYKMTQIVFCVLFWVELVGAWLFQKKAHMQFAQQIISVFSRVFTSFLFKSKHTHTHKKKIKKKIKNKKC